MSNDAHHNGATSATNEGEPDGHPSNPSNPSWAKFKWGLELDGSNNLRNSALVGGATAFMVCRQYTVKIETEATRAGTDKMLAQGRDSQG